MERVAECGVRFGAVEVGGGGVDRGGGGQPAEDEIPQLLNVIRGEMSIVGPRPALPYEVENYEPWQLDRLQATPGITGRWQVYGRSRVTFEEMVRMDIEYARRPSVWQDLKLMVLTVPALLAGSGAE